MGYVFNTIAFQKEKTAKMDKLFAYHECDRIVKIKIQETSPTLTISHTGDRFRSTFP